LKLQRTSRKTERRGPLCRATTEATAGRSYDRLKGISS
jgi:hypothetical protein